MFRRSHAVPPAFVVAATVLAFCPLPAAAGSPHEHGVARLDVAVDAKRLSILLQTPLDNLVGFEHAPRSDAERDKVAAAIARLRNPQALFGTDAAAGCTTSRVELQAAQWQLGATGPAKDGHADLDATYEFNCSNGGRASFLEVGLFEAFPSMQRVELQVATPKGQLKASLRRPSSRVMLAR